MRASFEIFTEFVRSSPRAFGNDVIGITIRTYQLWQKLYRSNAPLLKGASLTEVAYTADFVDSAHYSRAFQRAYGRAPSKMFRTHRVTIHAATPVSKARAALNPLTPADE